MPTEHNLARSLDSLGWQSTNDPAQAHFNQCHLNLDQRSCERLEYKQKLADMISQACPGVMPITHTVDSKNFVRICDQLSNKHHWILKPALLNNGCGIRLCPSISDVANYFLSNERYDGPHIVQRYIDPPHLLQGHKYSIRLFVVISNDRGCHLYPKGYFNVAKQAYKKQNWQRACHLTNEHLSHSDQADSIQIPTDKAPHFERIFPALQRITQQVIDAHRHTHPECYQSTDHSAFSLFGFDFMLDEHLRAWLLEVNHGPCFPTDRNHVLQSFLYDDFWQALTQQFVLPIANKQSQTTASQAFLQL